MYKRKKTFIDLCLEGRADLSDIDEYVEAWHTTDEDVRLHQFLGMTIGEYSLWVEKPQVLRSILFSKRFGLPVEQAADQMTESNLQHVPETLMK